MIPARSRPIARSRLLPARPPVWLALLTLSLLLHVLILSAVTGTLHMPAPVQSAAPALPVVLATLRAPALRPPANPVATRSFPVRAKPRRVPAPPVAVPRALVPVAMTQVRVQRAADTLATTTDTLPTVPADPAPAADTAAGVPPVPASSPPPAPVMPASTPLSSPSGYPFSLPPSARLDYEVRYATRGSITRGSSHITWQTGEGTYAIHGEVTKFGITLSSFRSEGGMDADGMAPALYAEKNVGRTETTTRFQRDAQQAILFSASTVTPPLLPGAQDRASILWQLAGMARGDPHRLVPGTVFDILVAGVRNAEHWEVQVIGEEAIVLEHGEEQAWHLVRAPRDGSDDKRLDIWLAPGQQWFPVRIRYTEVSGDYLDLSLAAVHE